MSSNQAPGQGSGGQQPGPQQARAPFFRPEQMRNLPDFFSAEEKKKWEQGLIQLYKQMENSAPDSQEYMNAKKKVHEFSNNLAGKIKQAKQQAQARASATNQNSAPSGQDNGAALNQNTAPAGRPGGGAKPSEQMMHHINNFPYALPPQIAPGTSEAAKWLNDAKTKYGRSLMAMETAQMQLRNLETMLKERIEQGNPLNENEQREFNLKKEQFQKGHAEAKRYSEGFRKSQEQQNELAAQKAGSASTGAGRTGSISQQASNSAQQNTETVHAAIQAARNQQRPSVPVNNQPTQQSEQTAQVPPSQTVNAPSNSSNAQAGNQAPTVKVETGISQPQVNTTLANAPHMQQNISRQQNSPHSAVPQSATSIGPPRALSHPAALAQAARTYSSTQASGTPNVMGAASHAHPSVPRETPHINTNKMPIPKQLPDRAIAPPQPVPMQPSRPTFSGGPTNAGSGLMGQPVLQKTPGFNLEGEGERVMNKRKLDELVRQVTGGGEGLDSGEGLTPEVEDVRFPFLDVIFPTFILLLYYILSHKISLVILLSLTDILSQCVLSVADEFVDQVITAACKCAKARGSKTLEIRDIQLILERNYNIRIPGYASDEIRTVRKFQPAQGWIAKMSAIQAAKVTGGKGDL